MARLLKFYSPLCGPCKVLEGNLKNSGIAYTDINIFGDENIDGLGTTDDIVEHYNIRSVPTLIKIDDSGLELDRRVGILSVEQIKEFAQ